MATAQLEMIPTQFEGCICYSRIARCQLTPRLVPGKIKSVLHQDLPKVDTDTWMHCVDQYQPLTAVQHLVHLTLSHGVQRCQPK